MENAPFGLNHNEIAYFKKVCKSVRFFAGIWQKAPLERESGAHTGPVFGVEDTHTVTSWIGDLSRIRNPNANKGNGYAMKGSIVCRQDT
jgi:hypothetical protein